MEKYLSLLIEQFKQANNIKNVDINSQTFISEFSEWIKLRQDVSKNYSITKSQTLDFFLIHQCQKYSCIYL